jgi:hypothetical protein
MLAVVEPGEETEPFMKNGDCGLQRQRRTNRLDSARAVKPAGRSARLLEVTPMNDDPKFPSKPIAPPPIDDQGDGPVRKGPPIGA